MPTYHQSTDISNEAERLRLLGLTANDTSKKALSTLARNGFKPSRILDAGCGTGDAFVVLKEVFPTAEIIGIDQSDKAVEIAKQRQIASSVLVGDILFPSRTKGAIQQSFDLVFVRNTLLHVPKVQHAIDQLKLMLQNNAQIIAQEPDWDTASANWKDFDIFKKAMMEAMRSHGINPTLGQNLEQLFDKSGLRDIKKEVHEYKMRPSDEGWKILDYLLEVSHGLIGKYLKETGISSAKEMQERFNYAQQNPNHYFKTPSWIVVSGVK